MRLFLDAKDLIPVLEERGPVAVEDLRRELESGGHLLVLTPSVIGEVAAPIVDPTARSVVTLLLNRAESLPHVYLAQTAALRSELSEAVSAFVGGRECEPISPYVSRYDWALMEFGSPQTANWINLPLAEAVFLIAQREPRAFAPRPDLEEKLREAIDADRKLPSPPPLPAHFRTRISRELSDAAISFTGSVEDLADWIYADPSRCPAMRLRFEVNHQIRKNTNDRLESSDLKDLAHVAAVPYVDVATLDRRMVGYVRQATRSWGSRFRPMICRRLDEALKALASEQGAG